MKQYKSFITLGALMLLLTGFQFISAAWTAPGGTPSSNNTPAPVNVGSVTQAKTGN